MDGYVFAVIAGNGGCVPTLGGCKVISWDTRASKCVITSSGNETKTGELVSLTRCDWFS